VVRSGSSLRTIRNRPRAGWAGAEASPAAEQRLLLSFSCRAPACPPDCLVLHLSCELRVASCESATGRGRAGMRTGIFSCFLKWTSVFPHLRLTAWHSGAQVHRVQYSTVQYSTVRPCAGACGCVRVRAGACLVTLPSLSTTPEDECGVFCVSDRASIA